MNCSPILYPHVKDLNEYNGSALLDRGLPDTVPTCTGSGRDGEAFVTAVIIDRITGQKSAHDDRDRCIPGTEQQMKMIRHQCPCETGCFCPG